MAEREENYYCNSCLRVRPPAGKPLRLAVTGPRPAQVDDLTLRPERRARARRPARVGRQLDRPQWEAVEQE